VSLFIQIDTLATRVFHDVPAVPCGCANDHVVNYDSAQERHDDLEPNVAADVRLKCPIQRERRVHDDTDQHKHASEFEDLTEHALCLRRTVVPDGLWLRDESNERPVNGTCQLRRSKQVL
jgi:hypothetical protein